MARKNNTLTDLSDFLNQNPNEIELGKVKSKEDFISRAPNNLVNVPKPTMLEANNNKTLTEIAKYLHDKAENENKSFTELWLQLLEEGVRIDPLLKHTTAFKTMRTIRKTSVSVVLEGITQLIKRK